MKTYLFGLISGLVTWGSLAYSVKSQSPPRLEPLDWWEHCMLYQIYPRSFKDTNGDGIGDLKGITNEMQHFSEAGVNAVWLSPIFKSPMVDFGYDISDYYDIHEEYGTMADFEELLDRAHELGLKVLLDFVPNHASIESDYFKKSVERHPLYKDFFIWEDGLPDPNNASNRLPPSNWISSFAGSMWEWHDQRKQFYLHQFSKQQVDFNFRNQAVKDEMINILKFWLDKGVDGFRVDALPYIYEADKVNGTYPDEPLSGRPGIGPGQLGYTTPLYTKDLIELYDVLYEWREFFDAYNEEHGGSTRVLITEAYTNETMTMLYYGTEDGKRGAHFPFNFGFVTRLTNSSNARDFVYATLNWLTYMPYGGTPNWQFGNHDNNRIPSKFRTDMVDGLNSLSMILPGTSVTYQGEEIGMRDGYVSWEDTVDIEACHRGDEDTYLLYSRDPARTPFQWDDTLNAGFSTANKTWLPVGLDYKEINLAKQKRDFRSHFKVYQAMTSLRNETTLIYGEYDIRPLSNQVFYVVRYLPTYDTYTYIFNVGTRSETVLLNRIPYLTFPAMVYVASIHSPYIYGDTIFNTRLSLKAGEAIILKSEPV